MRLIGFSSAQDKRKLDVHSIEYAALETLTGDFDLLDCFVALICDFDFDWDCLPVEIELETRTRQLESVKVANTWESREKDQGDFATVHLCPGKLLRGRAYRTS